MPKVKDMMFDGGTGRRIYGVIDVAKAARIASRMGDFALVAINADNYAVFTQAFYWRNIFGITPPPTLDGKTAPVGYHVVDTISDSEANYAEFELAQPSPSSAPPFPSPSCLPAADGGMILDNAVKAIGDFCLQQTETVSKGSPPISHTYDGGETHTIRFTLSWDDQGDCPASQSPSQNGGRDCNTVFHNILSGCK